MIHHLKLEVNNHKEALNFLTGKGIKVIQTGKQKGDKGINFYTYLIH